MTTNKICFFVVVKKKYIYNFINIFSPIGPLGQFGLVVAMSKNLLSDLNIKGGGRGGREGRGGRGEGGAPRVGKKMAEKPLGCSGCRDWTPPQSKNTQRQCRNMQRGCRNTTRRGTNWIPWVMYLCTPSVCSCTPSACSCTTSACSCSASPYSSSSFACSCSASVCPCNASVCFALR